VGPLKLNVIFNFSHARTRRPDLARSETDPGNRRDPNECRCLCGSLVARRVPDGVELKCRRCKRTVVLPLELTAPAPRAREATP
jgi:hypothetical protein